MSFIVFEVKSDDRSRSLTISSDNRIVSASICGFLEQTNSGLKTPAFHFTPEVGGSWYLVAPAFRLPVFGCIDYYNLLPVRPEFGCVLEMDEYAVVKEYGVISRCTEIVYYFRGVRVGSKPLTDFDNHQEMFPVNKLGKEPLPVPVDIRKDIIDVYNKIMGRA